jgi:hypothetical protein
VSFFQWPGQNTLHAWGDRISSTVLLTLEAQFVEAWSCYLDTLRKSGKEEATTPAREVAV